MIAIIACNGGNSSNSEHGHEHGHGGVPEGTSVVLSPSQMSALNLTLDSLHHLPLGDVLRLTGVIKVPPQSQAEVTVPIEGTIQSINVSEGDFVTKGQTLVQISNPSIVQLQQDYLESKSKLIYDEAEFKRQEELSIENVNSKKILQQAESNLNSGKARLSSLEKQLQLLGINASGLNENSMSTTIAIKAPISGTVSHISASIGSRSNFGLPLMKILDNSYAVLELFVFEQYLSDVKEGQAVNFTLTSNESVQYSAVVTKVGNSFEDGSKAVKVRAEIQGSKSGLIDLMNVNAFVSKTATKVTCVQNSAIVNYQGNDFIFIFSESAQHDLLHSGHEHEDEHEHESEVGHAHDEEHNEEPTEEPVAGSLAFTKIPIKKGVSSGGYTQITPLTDLPGDARIVVNGAFYVLAALTNRGEAHSH
jgi:RND family efflux transporter MFP subunit